METLKNNFKNERELFKYIANEGAMIEDTRTHKTYFFKLDGTINHPFDLNNPSRFAPYEAPKEKKLFLYLYRAPNGEFLLSIRPFENDEQFKAAHPGRPFQRINFEINFNLEEVSQ